MDPCTNLFHLNMEYPSEGQAYKPIYQLRILKKRFLSLMG